MIASLERGQVALPFILLVSGIIIEIVIAGSLITYFSSGSGYGYRLSSRAYAAAYSGLNDALIKVARDKDFGILNPVYEISIGEDKAIISFTSSSTDMLYNYSIISTGKAGTRESKLRALVEVGKVDGLVTLQSIEEVPSEE